MELRDMSDEELKAELAAYNKKIKEYPYWGAALAAYDEYRRGIIRVMKDRGIYEQA